jgi:hypothetical protein
MRKQEKEQTLCTTGQNSPANRPEFIDINLEEVRSSTSARSETEDLRID